VESVGVYKMPVRIWRLWAKSLGQKASDNDSESDMVARIRTLILLTYLITNCFIVAGVIRHWNKTSQINIQNEIQSDVSETKKERFLKTNCRSTFN